MGHGKGRCPNPLKEEVDGGFGGGDGGFGGGDGGFGTADTNGGGEWNTGGGDTWGAEPATVTVGGGW